MPGIWPWHHATPSAYFTLQVHGAAQYTAAIFKISKIVMQASSISQLAACLGMSYVSENMSMGCCLTVGHYQPKADAHWVCQVNA